MKISFHGGAGVVTGSNFVLESGETKIVVDCGLFQGVDNRDTLNYAPFTYSVKDIDAVFITHSHLDHIGRLPYLVKSGYRGPIFSTSETKMIAEELFKDTLSIQSREGKERVKERLYDEGDVHQTLSQWNVLPYHEHRAVGSLSVVLKDAGHILGSAMIEVTAEGKKVVFTGDLGNSPAPLLRNSEEILDANYFVIESVYGDRVHEKPDERTEKLEDIIEETIGDGGTLLIPAFSIERTQTVLFEIDRLIEEGKIPHVPVFIDSPLATKITSIYKKGQTHFNEDTRKIIKSGDDIFNFKGLTFVRNMGESRAIDQTDGAKIIIAGSGMSTGGRILNHEKRYLPDPKTTLLLVGFQAAGTPGRQILDGARTVTIDDEQVKIRATVRTLFGYSAHKDVDGLVEFVANSQDTLRKVFVVMGEPKSSMFLVQRIRDYLGIDAVAPKMGDTFTV